MAHSIKDTSSQVNYDRTKARKVNAPKIIEELMVQELPLSLEGRDMRELSVRTYPSNED